MEKFEKIYAAQINTGYENKYIQEFKARHPEIPVKFSFPQREINERHKGKIIKKVLPVFPGYIFLEFDVSQNIYDYLVFFKKGRGFSRFLNSNQNIRLLEGRDLQIILLLIRRENAVAEISKARFNEEDKIMITSGALMGLEGEIVKIDRRKGRAKVRLDLYGEDFSFDLSFETIKSAEQTV
ncbi:MAG: antiterminator LoaP [Spirochaetaceae bacterium]|jgi:transcriptional antiterminator NusG|nr:antiterminator LoaP [Spirochaetaceae bacterium]